MARSSATLSTQLQGISGGTEAAAITAWSGAWATYFAAATANGVAFTTTPATIAAARGAMEAAMVGMASSGQGAAKVQDGIVAWWNYLSANPGACFAGATAIGNPGLALTHIATDLTADFVTNNAPGVTAAQACDAIAASLHARTNGGQATISSSNFSIL